MLKAKVVEEVRRKIECPFCGGQSSFDITHLKAGNSFGPWYCEECGSSIAGTIQSDGSVDVEPRKGTKTKTLDLLCLPPQDHPVYFVVSGINISSVDSDTGDGKEYFYEEHACPRNWIDDVIEIISDGDNDPHGLFDFVASIPDTGTDSSSTTTEEWCALFAHPLK